MDQRDNAPIAITSDGHLIHAAVTVPPGMPQPLGVLPDGQPVWPAPNGTVRPGSPAPFGIRSDGQLVWAKTTTRPEARPLWKKKRVLIPAGIFTLLVVAGLAGGDDSTGNKSVEAAAAGSAGPVATTAPVDPVKAAADQAAADRTAADTTAAAEAKAVADRVAAEKAAADKAVADKAAADKATAEKAVAEKAAADKAKAEADREAAEKKAAGTTAQQNAAEKASDYLSLSAFSRKGLIEQLEFEGFSTADATFGVDKINADYSAQAAKKAKSYLDLSSFSRKGLIDQLVFEGFTSAQAAYGVSQVGL